MRLVDARPPGRLFSPQGWRAFRRALALLLAFDAALIGAFLVARAMVARDAADTVPFMLRIGSEGALGEIASSGKWLAIVLCLRAVWRARSDRLAHALSWVFVIVLADDMLQVHETAGGLLASALGFEARLGLRGQDFGELAAWATLGLVIAILLVRGLRHARPADLPLGIAMILALAALIFCGIALDMAGGLLDAAMGGTADPRLLAAIHVGEDAGELIFGSVACALAWAARSELRQGIG